tara:strand:+ start:574 stop:960 length:387 start_codon:yes stop_codon:yes gene_type:complete
MDQTEGLDLYAGIGKEDQIAIRRSNSPTSYGNPYDPESLMIGSEDQQGLTPYDKRLWPDLATYKEAVSGRLTSEEIVKIAPRVKGLRQTSYGDSEYSEPVTEGLKAESQGLTVLFAGAYAGGIGALIG